MEAEWSFDEQLERQQQKRLEQKRQARATSRADIPARTLAWLALPPDWTLHLATLCSFPRIGTSSVAETFERLVREQLCTDQTGDEHTVYVVSDSTRSELYRQLSESEGLGWLLQEVRVIARRLSDNGGAELPPDIARWAELASHVEQWGTEEVTNKLDEETKRLLRLQQTGQALRWIVTARQFEELLGDELTYAIQRATRRLDLFHRRADDLRALERFLPRPQQIDAFIDLLAGPDEHYMLHYIGDGGMGKTMLARYLNSTLADELHLSTARIDFDYLNPDFPQRRPGLLLQELAIELRLQDEDDSTKSVATHFRRFDEKLMKEHERRSGQATRTGERFHLNAPGVYEMLLPFVDALQALPRQPVVLILDTCEELAKIRPDGTLPESVQATFSMLDSLHQLVPSMRVVFCGRRPLAAEGADWEMRVKDPKWTIKRSGLLLHEIRGFTQDEALLYLSEKAALPEALRAPVVERSRMPAERSRFTWSSQLERNEAEDLYNPFDLALYASWMNEELSEQEEVSEETLARLVEELRGLSGDRYAEMRIVRRNPMLTPLLPAVTLLGRFEKETLHTILPGLAGDFETLFHELTQQEWLDRQQSAFYEVKRGLLPRLLAYYQQAEPALLERTRGTILAHLEQITLERDLSTLDISHFNIALRLFAKEPERGASWWHAVEGRVAHSEESYHWFRPVTEFLLSDGGAVAGIEPMETQRQEHPLRIGVLATHCAILTHTEPETDRGLYWQEVAQKAESYPLAEEGSRLSQRALCGQLASLEVLEKMSADEFLEMCNHLWQGLKQLADAPLDAQLYASYIAALESILSAFVSEMHPYALESALFPIHEALSAELKGFLWMLTGRLSIKAGNGNEARSWFQRAIQVSPARTSQFWLDWLVPDDPAARVGLECIDALYPLLLSTQEVLNEINAVLPAIIDASPRSTLSIVNNIDEDRLLAVSLLLQGYIGHVVTPFQPSPQVGPMYRPTADIHRAYPPLFAVLAGIMADNGQVQEALDYLASYKKEAERVADQLDTVVAADRASLLIIRRMRLRDENWPFTAGQMDTPMYWALQGLDGLKAATFEEQLLHEAYAEDMSADKKNAAMRYMGHIRWRASYTLDLKHKQSLCDWFAHEMATLFDPGAWDVVSIALKLDMLELELLSHQQNVGLFFASLSPNDAERLSQWFVHWTEQPVEALTLGLRYHALTNNYQVPPSLVERIGKRRAASIALDEGELLALRLPAHAAILLLQARTWFAETGDYGQAWIAGTCRTLALVRLGPGNDMGLALEQVQSDYQSFVKTLDDVLPNFPSWEMLTALASNPTNEALHGLAPRTWRPWLVRLIACLVWLSGNRVQEIRLFIWLQDHYGRVVGKETNLPAELDGPFAFGQMSLFPPLNFRGSGSRKSAQITISIGLSQTYSPKSPNAPALSIEEPIVAALRILNDNAAETAVLYAMALDAYASAASNLTERYYQEIVQTLRFHRTGRSTTDPIILQLTQETSGICWEGILALAAKDGMPDWRTLRFHRVVRVQRRTLSAVFKEKHLVCLTGNRKQAELLRTAWQPLERLKWTVNVNVGESLASLLRTVVQRSVAVLHLVTSPVETASGLRLENASTYREARGEGLLEVEAIPDRFPNLKFCILQCPPQESTERTSSERAQIGNMRLLAARLFADGVPLVLTMPVLTSQQSTRVLEVLAQALLKADWKEALDKAIIDARVLLLNEGTTTCTERAFDLCLYTGDDTDYR